MRNFLYFPMLLLTRLESGNGKGCTWDDESISNLAARSDLPSFQVASAIELDDLRRRLDRIEEILGIPASPHAARSPILAIPPLASPVTTGSVRMVQL